MKMNSNDFVAAMLVGLLAFRQQFDADAEAAAGAKTLETVGSTPTDEETEDDVPEMEPEAWTALFEDYISKHGLSHLFEKVGTNHRCIAALYRNEPAFTLRGQDILASIMVRHWAALASLNTDCPQAKIDHAEGIAEKMEEYQPQKWPD